MREASRSRAPSLSAAYRSKAASGKSSGGAISSSRASAIASISSARQRERLDRGAERERDRTACGLAFALAERRLAPPGDPDRRQIGIAGARARLPDLVIEAGEGEERVPARRRRVERAEPLVARVCPRQRGAMPVSLRQRLGADRGRRRHGVAIRTAATRRSSDCMTL